MKSFFKIIFSFKSSQKINFDQNKLVLLYGKNEGFKNEATNNLIKNKDEPPEFSSDAIDVLKRHLWPGNIRELKNVLERSYILFSGRKIEKNHVLENLIRLKAPTSKEEQEALWDATQKLEPTENNNSLTEVKKAPLLYRILNIMLTGLTFLKI